MTRAPLVVFALVMGAAACKEIATSPQSNAEMAVKAARLSNPPPPPIDTGAGFNIAIESALRPGSMGALSTISFVVPVQYMLNKDGGSGYLHFNDDPANNVDSDPNGMVKMSKGVFDGKGFVTFMTPSDGPLVIDLASVNQSSFFAGCGPVGGGLSPDASRPDSGCFQVTFDNATLNGVPVGPVTAFPACVPRPENFFCDEPE